MSAARPIRRVHAPTRLGVDVRGALALVGALVKLLSLTALFPLALALAYGEPPWPFLAALAAGGLGGLALERLEPEHARVGFREGFLVVALTWLAAALYGMVPYLLSGDPQLEHPVDALFESMSGFTTTGSSILVDIEGLDRSLAMWRQLTQWIGGMGIIVLALAVLPRLQVGGRQLLEKELPGPELATLGERIRQTAQRLWLLYVSLTAVLAVTLAVLGWSGLDGEMTLYDAVAHAFTTMPTGGFSPRARSLEEFGGITQWVVIVFMVLAGINFALLYRAVARRRPRVLARDEELRAYLIILVAASALLTAVLYVEDIAGSQHAIRNGVFQAVSIVTTTGYASTNFNDWTTLAAMTLVALMFVGGSAGSTGGGVKVVRHLLVARAVRREVRLTVRPELVQPVRLNDTVVDERVIRAVIGFVLLYLGIFVAGTAVLAVDTAIQGPALGTLDVIAATATTLGNVGPGLGPEGPMGSFASLSAVSKLTLTALMWLGRLEILPVLIVLSRRYWRV